MSVWYTSDLHLGHRLVAGLRGFSDTDAHDDAIEGAWRAHVRPDDHVWVLGDIAVSRPDAALERLATLPAAKHLISGNHDACHPMHRSAHRKTAPYLAVFDSVQPFARRKINGEDVLLSHFPYDSDRGIEARYPQYRLANCGAWLLHGHTHLPERRTSAREIHVGVDAWNLAPVSDLTIGKMMTDQS
jgi:calcineurin-like phosphoesterase family protein